MFKNYMLSLGGVIWDLMQEAGMHDCIARAFGEYLGSRVLDHQNF